MMRHAIRNDVFRAIGDPTRRTILDLLAQGDQPVMTLAEPFDVSLPAISQHLSVLKDAGLVSEKQVGRQRYYHLCPEPLREISEWVEQYERFWNRKLKSLGEHLNRKRKR